MRLPNSNGHLCMICGAPATAIWWPKVAGNDKPLTICSDCAISVFPALAADAPHGNPDLTLAQMTSNFWHAQFCLQRDQVKRLQARSQWQHPRS